MTTATRTRSRTARGQNLNGHHRPSGVEGLLNYPQLAAFLGVSRATVERMVSRGELPPPDSRVDGDAPLAPGNRPGVDRGEGSRGHGARSIAMSTIDTLTREVTERMLNASAALPNAPTLPTLDPVALLRHVFELELRFNGGRPFPPRGDGGMILRGPGMR